MRRAVFLGLVLLATSHLSFAQTTFALEGYIGSAHLPASFRAGGRTIVLTRHTTFGFIGSGTRSNSDPALRSLRVGAYVQVAGSDPDHISPIAAEVVLVRDENNQKLSGIGVITRVVKSGPDPMYEADGYLIHVTSSTHLSFAGDLSSLSEIAANTWIHFAGKRNSDGTLEASHAQFIPAKPTKFKAIKGVEIQPVQVRPVSAPNGAAQPAAGRSSSSADASLQEGEQVKLGLGRWHTIPADQPLQQRVHRIGMTLVPAYQRQMDDSDPSKIHFRFFAVDDEKLHKTECLLDGAILVSRQMIDRLPNDDQLAAVLADGIACNLQRQAARTVVEMRKELGIQLAADVAEVFFPPAGLIASAHSVAAGNPEERLAEERLRIALALMQDAGYDPWQSPEAWRLAAPKKLPADLASLEYPDSGCYQLSVLYLQYARTGQQQKQ